MSTRFSIQQRPDGPSTSPGAVFRTKDGTTWRVIARCPLSELTTGSRFMMAASNTPGHIFTASPPFNDVTNLDDGPRRLVREGLKNGFVWWVAPDGRTAEDRSA